MPLDDRYPHFPDHVLGYVYARDGVSVVVWADDKSVGVPEGHDTPLHAVTSFESLLGQLRRQHHPTWASLNSAILAHGWSYRGTLRYDVRSGLLYQDAVAMAAVAEQLTDDRQTLLITHGGRHPEMGSPDWPMWMQITLRRNASARGALMLAIAGVEALVNELLATRYPGEYDQWEVQGRKRSFWAKLRGLVELIDDTRADDLGWFQQLEQHVNVRSNMLHHRPQWLLDERPHESVEPDEMLAPARVRETLASVGRAFEGLFGLFGVAVPETHRSEWALRLWS